MSSARLLPRSFFARDSLAVARELVGALLVRRAPEGDVVIRITETEAYGEGDTASHVRMGRTPRNAPMWGEAGKAYVYFVYGMHHMLNLVTGAVGEGQAVLIRSAEPVANLELVRARRGGREGPTLLNGPGKIAQALALDLAFNHHDLTKRGALEARRGEPPAGLLVGPRVGVDYADPADRDAPWRFAAAGTKWISVPKTLRPLRRR